MSLPIVSADRHAQARDKFVDAIIDAGGSAALCSALTGIKVVGASLLEGYRPPDGVHTCALPHSRQRPPQPDTFTDTCRCFTSRWRQGMAWPRWSAEQDGDRAHR